MVAIASLKSITNVPGAGALAFYEYQLGNGPVYKKYIFLYDNDLRTGEDAALDYNTQLGFLVHEFVRITALPAEINFTGPQVQQEWRIWLASAASMVDQFGGTAIPKTLRCFINTVERHLMEPSSATMTVFGEDIGAHGEFEPPIPPYTPGFTMTIHRG